MPVNKFLSLPNLAADEDRKRPKKPPETNLQTQLYDSKQQTEDQLLHVYTTQLIRKQKVNAIIISFTQYFLNFFDFLWA